MILLRWILIYNILISEICLYLLFKPFQFYRQDLIVGNNNKQIVCEINSIHNNTAEILTYTIWISIPLMLFHVMYILYRLCIYGHRWYVSYRNENRNRQESISLELNQQISYGSNNNYQHIEIKKYKLRWGFCAILVLGLMLFFLSIGIYAMVVMIKVSYVRFDTWKTAWIASTIVLLILSIFDNPWLFYKCKLCWFWCFRKDRITSRRIMSPLNT
eukprot:244060_1